MIDVFNIAKTAPQDKSIEYLQQVFGEMSGVLSMPGASPGDTVTLVGQMFKTFNTVMLAVGVLIILYVIVTSTLRTAHEGEVMGRQGSALWTPLRIVLGIAGLFPMGVSGYCLFQIIMMWVVVQGIGAADSLWKTVTTYSAQMGSPYAKITIPSSGSGAVVRDLFKGLVCEATLAETSPTPDHNIVTLDPQKGLVPLGGLYFCSIPGNSLMGAGFCATGNYGPLDPNKDTYFLGPLGRCGVIKHCTMANSCPNNMDPNSNEATLACKVCSKQLDDLNLIITADRDIAKRFVATDYAYRDFYYNSDGSSVPDWIQKFCSDNGVNGKCCVNIDGKKQQCVDASSGTSSVFPDPNAKVSGAMDKTNASAAAVQTLYWPYNMQDWVGKDDPNFLATQISFMTQNLNDTVDVYLKALSNNSTQMSQTLQDATNTGWLFAGAYYYVVGKFNQNNQASALPTLSVILNTNVDTDFTGYRINDTAAKALVTAVAATQNVDLGSNNQTASVGYQVQGGGGLSQDANLGDIGSLIDELKADLTSVFTNGVLPQNTNPIFAAQGMGFALLILLEIFYPLLLWASIALGLIGNINVFVVGNSVMDPIGPMATLVYFVLIPALYGLMGIMATYGGLLGVYVPLIPFMIFTAAAVTWFMQVLEMLVAGPLMALGIMMPGGHHELLGRAEQGLMMLLNLFLRPSLMIFGLMVGMLISTVLCELIFYTFWQIFIPQAGQPGLAFLAWVFYLGAFVALVVAAVNKSYAAIYILPDRVITWISGHAGQGGEAEMASEAKHAIEGGARGMGTAAKGTADAGKGFSESAGQSAKAQRESKAGQATKANDNQGGGSDISGGG